MSSYLYLLLIGFVIIMCIADTVAFLVTCYIQTQNGPFGDATDMTISLFGALMTSIFMSWALYRHMKDTTGETTTHIVFLSLLCTLYRVPCYVYTLIYSGEYWWPSEPEDAVWARRILRIFQGISAFISLILVPAMCSLYSKDSPPQTKPAPVSMPMPVSYQEPSSYYYQPPIASRYSNSMDHPRSAAAEHYGALSSGHCSPRGVPLPSWHDGDIYESPPRSREVPPRYAEARLKRKRSGTEPRIPMSERPASMTMQ